MEENKMENKIDIELTPDVAAGVYSNLQIVQHSPSEFVVDFIQIAPGLNKAQVRSRVILAPMHAKKLLRALQENVQKYESTMGKIKEEVQATPNFNAMNPMGKA